MAINRYQIPVKLDSSYVEHSDLGLRAVDGWPDVLVTQNGVEYFRANVIRSDGELIKVRYRSSLAEYLTVFND